MLWNIAVAEEGRNRTSNKIWLDDFKDYAFVMMDVLEQ
jgi:hypothetical protein